MNIGHAYITSGEKPAVPRIATGLLGAKFSKDKKTGAFRVEKIFQGQSCNDADILVCEPNIKVHKVFKLTDYKEAYEKADIVVFLTAHKPFKSLEWREDKEILDFCGIFKK